MTRKAAREIAVRLCFQMSARSVSPDVLLTEMFDREYYETLAPEDEIYDSLPDEKQMEYITHLVRGIGEHLPELDGYIEKYAKGWKFERISRTALAVMKTAMYEIMYMPDIPAGAAINEAIELAKKYEEPETVPFVNGVLGSFLRGEVSAP